MALQRGVLGCCLLLATVRACLASDAPSRNLDLFRQRDARPWLGPYQGPTHKDVDSQTLRKKVLCGYQGWFACPGDDLERGWVHWSRDAARITPNTLSFEMWPDMSEYTDDEKDPAPGFTH